MINGHFFVIIVTRCDGVMLSARAEAWHVDTKSRVKHIAMFRASATVGQHKQQVVDWVWIVCLHDPFTCFAHSQTGRQRIASFALVATRSAVFLFVFVLHIFDII